VQECSYNSGVLAGELTEMSSERVDGWLVAALEKVVAERDLPVAEFLVRALHQRGHLTADSFAMLSQMKLSAGLLDEARDLAGRALLLNSENTLARSIKQTLDAAARVYLVDGEPRAGNLLAAAEFLERFPDRGTQKLARPLRRSGREATLSRYELQDMMIVGGEGVIFDPRTTQVIGESFSSRPRHEFCAALMPPSLKVDTRSAPQIKGAVAHLCGQWSGNFFHWIHDLLPRVRLLQKANFDGTYLVPAPPDPFFRESLELLGIPADRILPFNGVALRCDEVVFFDCLSARDAVENPDLLLDLRAALMGGAGIEIGRAPRSGGIYIRRSGSRAVQNEAALLPYLERCKIESIVAESLSFREQIARAAEAALLVGPHGSGLSLSLFMPPESAVIEFVAADYINPCFLSIARALQHRYYPIPSLPVEFERVAGRVEPALEYVEKILEQIQKEARQ
jgi:hypothetical protein